MTQRIFDTHLHIIDPAHPLVENNGFMPGPFTVDDYQRRIDGLGIKGGAVVSGSFQAFDQGYLIDALKALGPNYVGVTQVPGDTSDTRILELHEAGVRAVRFNVARGGSANLDDIDRLARRVHDLAGWHAEFYIDARTIDESLSRRIAALPAASIDHLGMHEDGLSNPAAARGAGREGQGHRIRPRGARSRGNGPRDRRHRPNGAHGRHGPALHAGPAPVPGRGPCPHRGRAARGPRSGRLLEQRGVVLPGGVSVTTRPRDLATAPRRADRARRR